MNLCFHGICVYSLNLAVSVIKATQPTSSPSLLPISSSALLAASRRISSMWGVQGDVCMVYGELLAKDTEPLEGKSAVFTPVWPGQQARLSVFHNEARGRFTVRVTREATMELTDLVVIESVSSTASSSGGNGKKGDALHGNAAEDGGDKVLDFELTSSLGFHVPSNDSNDSKYSSSSPSSSSSNTTHNGSGNGSDGPSYAWRKLQLNTVKTEYLFKSTNTQQQRTAALRAIDTVYVARLCAYENDSSNNGLPRPEVPRHVSARDETLSEVLASTHR
jgi:hypothetical protein